VEKAAVAGSLTLLAASPAHASQTDEVVGFLKAFLEFRTKDPTSFLLYSVAPILVPYAVFTVLVGKKEIRRKEELAAGGWDKFMAERGLDIETLKLPQLNAFAIAAEKDLLDDEMVTEFVQAGGDLGEVEQEHHRLGGSTAGHGQAPRQGGEDPRHEGGALQAGGQRQLN
jgi:hypothetical protein